MYERNINVLEMFVEKKLGYVETNNIKNNYYDYKELVKILDDYINICDAESKARLEYEKAVTNIQTIQTTKEKLYNQNVKFEYSRNMLFSDINRKVEDIEKCLTKIESALDKNKDAFKTLRKNFIQGIIDLNEKSRALKKIARPKNKLETEYNDALALIKENYLSINPDDITLARKFVESSADFEEELVEKMMRNGKDEKVPFDKNAITAATKLGLDIAQKEAENYLFMYDQTGKILGELENDKLKIEARKKHITDVGVKQSFLNVEKDYLVQFLDNERVTAIQGQAEHDRLMKNCCDILKEDVAQFNILYDLIIKESKKRATKRCYEELYNKSYLENIQEKEKQFIEKTTNIDYANGTIISPNYWRIDNIKAIYENFDKNVYETYGRKFVAPQVEEDTQPQIVERVVERVVEKVVEKPVEKIIERVVEKPLEIVAKNPEFTELNSVTTNPKVSQYTKEEQQQEEKPKKIFKFKRIKKKNQILEDDINFNVADEDEIIKQETKQEQLENIAKIQETETIESNENSQTSQTQNINNTETQESNKTSIVQNAKVEEVTTNTSTSSSDDDEESMFTNSKEKSEDEELEDIEAIIREAEASLSSKAKKANLIKKMVKKNKGKYAEE